ncbi:MAG: C-GCAxxG-C-C family protein [Actinomycetota bacterium]
MGEEASEREVLDRLERRALEHLMAYGSCAQSSLKALQDEFGLESAETLKAATAMPGVALRGDTCGAVIGPVMALGLAFGRDRPEDTQALMLTLQLASRFCRSFEEELGSCSCAGVQERLFGRSFNLTDPQQIQEFAAAGAAERCGVPVAAAVRIAGRLIMEARRQ